MGRKMVRRLCNDEALGCLGCGIELLQGFQERDLVKSRPGTATFEVVDEGFR